MFRWRWTRRGQGSENTFQQLGCGKVVDDIQSKCGPLKGSVPRERLPIYRVEGSRRRQVADGESSIQLFETGPDCHISNAN